MVPAGPDNAANASAAWQRFRQVNRFGSLDGLRCLSILGVIWHHGPGFSMIGLGGAGLMGVPLFFAISGFLITTLLLRERERGDISLKGFYARRSLRIFPLYYSVLGLYVFLSWLTPRAGSAQFLGNVPYFLTYTSNWFVGRAGTFAFAWSLASEEQFYATWPWLMKYVGPRRAIWWLLVLLGVAIGLHFMPRPPLHGPLALVVLHSVQMAICWGCLLALLLHSERGFALLWSWLGWRWTAPILLALLAVTLSQPNQAPIASELLFGLLVGACVIREDSVLAPLLRLRPVAHVGVISYGMYLLHGLVYDVLDEAGGALGMAWNPHGLVGFVVATAGTVAVATISFRFFESPFLKMKERFSPARRRTATA